MFTKYMDGGGYFSDGNILADGYIEKNFNPAAASRLFMTFECDNPNNVPVIVKSVPSGAPTYEEALQIFGDSTGVMIAPFSVSIPQTTTTRFTFTEAVNDVRTYSAQTADMIYLSRSVGPVSISTYGLEAVAPFTVAILCKPLFLEPFPALTFYQGPTGSATGLTAFIASLVGLYEWDATEKIVNKQVRCNVNYAYSSVANIGKVVSATATISGDTAAKYTIVATLEIGIPENGFQDSVTICSENPADYTKRAYIPRRGSHDELGYVPMPPIVLSCENLNEVQASGRLRYEHSILLAEEAPVNRYSVSAYVLSGAGNVSIYDNQQEYAELPEYEY